MFAAVFLLYAASAYPWLAPRDSGDLASAALTLGPAHPPGYPLYSLLGRAWVESLRLGDPAYRLNLLSAAAGAGACALLYASAATPLAGLTAAAALALSGAHWKFSLLCEMYSLHALFLAALLFLAEGRRETEASRARLSGLVLGLGLVNHQALVLALPAAAWLWRGRWRLLLPGAAAGLALYAAVAVRLGGLGAGLDAVLRREYGTLTLSPAYSGALTAASAAALLRHLGAGVARECGWPALALAAAGLWRLRLESPRLFWGLLLLLAAFGPGFFLLTRFRLDDWVAVTVLESAFVAVSVAAAAAAGRGVPRAPLAAAAALALVVGFGVARAPSSWHRDDFSAYDYVRDLRRSLPPGGQAVVAGDTALFGLRYAELTRGGPRGARPYDPRTGPAPYLSGLTEEGLRSLGAWPDVAPEALAQRAGGSADCRSVEAGWERAALRRGSALLRDDPYARDIRRAYAFSRFVSGRLLEERGLPCAAEQYMWAGALDPRDFQLDFGSGARD